MSWSDDMRCLHCDGKLPLYRKITHGQFCSTAHRKAYWQDQERLAVERLHQTHSALKAMRPVAAVESILGPAIEPKSELSGFVPAPLIYAHAQGAPRMLAADPLVYDMDLAPGKPLWSPAEHAVRSVPGAGLIRLLEVWFSGERKAPSAVRARGGDLNPRMVALPPVHSLETPLPALEFPLIAVVQDAPEQIQPEPVQETSAEPAGPPLAARVPLPLALSTCVPAVRPGREALASRMPRPTRRLRLELAPVTPELQPAPRPDAPSFADWLLPLRSLQAREAVLPRPIDVAPLEATLPLAMNAGAPPLRSLSLSQAASAVPLRQIQPLQTSTGGAEPGAAAPIPAPLPAAPALKIAARELTLAMGRGSRYPVQYRKATGLIAQPDPLEFPKLSADIALPQAQPAPQLDPHELLDAVVPALAGMVALKVQLGPGVTKPVQPLLLEIATIPQPLRTEHMIPASGLEPIEAPVSPEFEAFAAASPVPGLPNTAPKVHLWTRAAGFWKVAPRDLKLLTCCIPVLLALAFHRQLPKVHVAGPSVSTVQVRQSLRNVVNTQFSGMRQAVVERAGVALDDDFRSGLDDWASRGDATAEWSFDNTGFVRPGPLALYRPSMSLNDYQLQFLGLIDKKAMSWVVRAADFDNYYVVKLEVLKPGPLTTLQLTRYAVIHGKAENRVDTPVRIVDAQPDTLYRVAMDLDGENFSLLIQGQMVDSWSEPRLTRGGVGFFTSKGEESRIRWISVRHQYDMLGRLCAYLAPYETPTTNGSW